MPGNKPGQPDPTRGLDTLQIGLYIYAEFGVTGKIGAKKATMPGPSLSLEVKQLAGATIVKLVGDIDAASIEVFQKAIEPLCQQSQPRVYLDCSGLNYVNSAGFGLLFTLTRACSEKNGELVLCTPRTKVLNVMHVLGLEHLLNVTQESAVARAQKQTSQT